MDEGIEQLSTHDLALAAACIAIGYRLVSTEPSRAIKPPGFATPIKRLGILTFEVPTGFADRFWNRELTVEPRAYSSALNTARRIADEAIARGYSKFADGTEGQWSSRRPSHREGRR